MQTSMVLKFLKVIQPISLNVLVHFETVQKATVSTAGAEIQVNYNLNS